MLFFAVFCLQPLVEAHCAAHLVRGGVPLGKAADQLERAKGVEAEEAALARQLRTAPAHRGADGIGLGSVDEGDVVPRITNTMLSTTLRGLEELGIVHRGQFNEIPPHVEYSRTEKGRAPLPVFTALARWGENHLIPQPPQKADTDFTKNSSNTPYANEEK